MTKSDGFVMADALVALLLLSLLLSTLIPLNASGRSSLSKADAKLTATLLAKRLIDRESPAEESGNVTIEGREYSWRVLRETRPAAFDDVVVLDLLTAEVAWSSGNASTNTTLSTLRWRLK